MGFIDAVNELAASVGMSVPQAPASPQKQQAARQRPSLLECMGQAARFYKQSLKRSPEAIAYLKKRGLTGEIAARFALGYAPDGWTPLQQAFDDYLDDNLVECGLVQRRPAVRRIAQGKARGDFAGQPAFFQVGNRLGRALERLLVKARRLAHALQQAGALARRLLLLRRGRRLRHGHAH
jgi:DNA primase